MALWVLAGGAVGAANTLTRWWTVSRLQPDMRAGPLALAMGGMIPRLALVAALLILALRQGIVPGLLAFAGLSLVRWGGVIWFGALRPCKARGRTSSAQ